MSAPTLERTETTNLPTIDFVSPMPGFPEEFHFVLEQVHNSDLLYKMISREDPTLRFLVTMPAPFFADYEPEIPDEALEMLDVRNPDNLLIYLVLSAPNDDPEQATANLRAPIIVDQTTRRAIQVVLADMPIQQPFTKEPGNGARPKASNGKKAVGKAGNKDGKQAPKSFE
jgi:flagellar assembly factor FliW